MFRTLCTKIGSGLAIGLLCNLSAAVIFKTDLISPKFLGYGQAGTAATVGDASSAYFNPAALTEIGKTQFVFAGVGFHSNTKLSIDRASKTFSSTMQSGLPEVSKPKANILTGSFFLSVPLMEDWVLGLGVTSPFRYRVEYDSEFASRYQAELFDFNSYQIFPTLAIKLTDKFSFGFGIDFLRTILKYQSSRGFNSAADGFYHIRARDWSAGYHLGVCYQLAPECRLGMTYFSRFKLNLSGLARSQNPSAPFTVSPGVVFDNTAEIELYLPESVVYSISYDIDAEWALMSDLEWTHWSRVKQLSVVLDNGQIFAQTFDLKNSFRISFGGHYRVNPCWMMRGGFTWEDTPVQPMYRNLLIPESHQVWFSLGLGYLSQSGIGFDIGYRYGFFRKQTIDSQATHASLSGPNVSGSRLFLAGDIRSNKHILGAQLSWSIC